VSGEIFDWDGGRIKPAQWLGDSRCATRYESWSERTTASAGLDARDASYGSWSRHHAHKHRESRCRILPRLLVPLSSGARRRGLLSFVRYRLCLLNSSILFVSFCHHTEIYIISTRRYSVEGLIYHYSNS